MRHKGRITEWQDDRGFGFITPMSGGKRVFVHIKSFTDRRRRPAGNELVTYVLKHDRQGRLQGADVRFSTGSVRPAPARGPGIGSLLLAAAALVVVAAAFVAGRLPFWVPGIYAGLSVVTFLVYAWDKSSARSNRWRVAEGKLHLLGLLGGWPGAIVAQKVLRHKSIKRPFRVVFWGTVALNCAALIWVLMEPDVLLGFGSQAS